MEISKIVIQNFKSIDTLEFNITKYGASFTTMLLGVNESWKSNILEAMSFLKTPKGKFNFNEIHNQKDENNSPVDLWYNINFEDDNTYLQILKKKFVDWSGPLLNLKITNIVKNVYLLPWEEVFLDGLDFDITDIPKGYFIKEVLKPVTSNGQVLNKEFYELSKKDDGSWFVQLDAELFKDTFEDDIIKIIKDYEPTVSYWKPSDEYLISTVNLDKFKDNIDSNIPLKHIFALSWFTKKDEIAAQIDKIWTDANRRKLTWILSKNATKYVKEIWNHKIEIDIEIKPDSNCVVLVKDEWVKNEYNYFKMTERSEWFKQFMSLILSLSIETSKLSSRNKLILIDEPENHLHPSWVIDLKDELLRIWEKNYLFVSTHSPFLVDRVDKERNIIIKKNWSAITEKQEINNEEDILDDEVLKIAFGINAYKDLLIPHRILVEWGSDKLILQKALNIQKSKKYWITNWIGSNIVSTASQLNREDISVLVIVDDDSEWRGYKDKILQIGWVFNQENVVTLKDLINWMKSGGTIEDSFPIDFVKSKFKEFYESEFNEQIDADFTLTDNAPFLEDIKLYLKWKGKYTRDVLDKFKIMLSEKFNPTKESLNSKFMLLSQILQKISEKL